MVMDENLSLVLTKVRLYVLRNIVGHFGLEAEYVVRLAIVALSPKVLICRASNQLNPQPDPLPRTLVRALYYRVNIQLARNLWDELVGALVKSAGGTRDDPQPSHFCEIGDDLVC